MVPGRLPAVPEFVTPRETVVLTVGLAILSLFSLAYLRVESAGQLILVRVLHGASAGLVIPIAMAYIGEISPKEFIHFINPEKARLTQVLVRSMGDVQDALAFFMGKNTPARRDFIVENLISDIT